MRDLLTSASSVSDVVIDLGRFHRRQMLDLQERRFEYVNLVVQFCFSSGLVKCQLKPWLSIYDLMLYLLICLVSFF